MKFWTTKKIRALKGQKKFATITAYDTITAHIADEAGIPLILVGDSLGPTTLGFSSTIPVTMDIMLHHTKAVSRGAGNSLVVADMPFLSYQVNEDEAVRNAGKLIQEGNADAVKLEGGSLRKSLIKRLTLNGIPVMAHIGMLPQNAKTDGYAYKGKTDDEFNAVIQDALAVEAAGAFATVIECADSSLAKKITETLTIPTIGIGAGVHCDGQILVFADIMGLTDSKLPKFVKQYANTKSIMVDALKQYTEEVESSAFPTQEHIYK